MAAWAALASIGRRGFRERTRKILHCTRAIARGVQDIPGLFLMGDQRAMIVCFGAKGFNVLRVADAMAKKGWSLNSLQHPNAVHLCCTVRTVGHEGKFLKDLEEATAAVRASTGDKVDDDSSAAIYGMAGGMPNGPVKELMFTYTDIKLMV